MSDPKPARKIVTCIAPFDLKLESIEIKKFTDPEERLEISVIMDGVLYEFAVLRDEIGEMLLDRAADRAEAH
jgi:hypothetical protein